MPAIIGFVISVITQNFKRGIVVEILKKIFSKKTLIRWIAPMGLALGAAAAGMQNAEFKEAICGAPVLESK